MIRPRLKSKETHQISLNNGAVGREHKNSKVCEESTPKRDMVSRMVNVGIALSALPIDGSEDRPALQ
jgi:hypothetical protein